MPQAGCTPGPFSGLDPSELDPLNLSEGLLGFYGALPSIALRQRKPSQLPLDA